VFIFRFFTGSIIGVICGIVLSLLLMGIILTGTTAALMATGGPEACDPATEVVVNQANSDSFKTKWEAFDALVEGGQSSSVTFNESEIASRAESWINEEDAPFEDVLVCLHENAGEASATVNVLGMDVEFLIKGTLDLSGDKPEAKIDDISVGNVPGFMMAPVEAIVDRALDEGLNDMKIEDGYTLTLKEGEARIDGVPRPDTLE
jgi:hypothetical protein